MMMARSIPLHLAGLLLMAWPAGRAMASDGPSAQDSAERAAASGPSTGVEAPPSSNGRSTVEVLGPHDLLEISVFDLDQFSRTVRVADDGSITLPFLGRIEAAGLTRIDLERRIADLLGEKWVN